MKKKVKKCYFCGKPATSRHHIIPRRIGGKGLKNNQEDMCDNCHDRLHTLLDPVIDYLLGYMKQLQDQIPMPIRKIGFVRTNHYKKKVKKNIDQTYHDGQEEKEMRLNKGFELMIARNGVIILSFEGRVVNVYNLPKEMLKKMKQDIKTFKEERNEKSI